MSEDMKNKTRAQIKRERADRLKEEVAKLTKEAKILEAREQKAAAIVMREKESRMKNHVGGTANMTGLLRYVYNDTSLHDNPQDELIENLLAGVFWKSAEALAKANADELIKLYDLGGSIRGTKPKDRVLPELNPYLMQLFDYVRQTNVSELKTNDCQNVDEVDDAL